MIKLLIIKDPGKFSPLAGLFSTIFMSKKYEFVTARELQKLFETIEPDLVFTDIKKPVSGNDLMSMVSKLDEFTRLRVYYINIFSFRKLFRFPSFNPKDFVLSLLFEKKTLKKSS
jgi:hypothetical protein